MKFVVLSDKKELDFIIDRGLKSKISIDCIVSELNKKGIHRSPEDIAYVLKLGLKGKDAFVDEEVNYIKLLYSNYNCGFPSIVSELAKKGYRKDKYSISDLVSHYKLKKGVGLLDFEKKIIEELYVVKKLSVSKIHTAIANPLRHYYHIRDYIKENNITKFMVWTEEDLRILDTYYSIGGSKLCVEKGINASFREIITKAHKRGLSTGRVIQKWSKSEDEFIIANVNIHGREYVANKLKRSIDSVSGRMNKLGVVRIKGWSDSELNILKKYYPEGGSTLCKEKGLNRSYNAISTKATICGYKWVKNKSWSEIDLKLLVKYYPQGGSRLCVKKGIDKEIGAICVKANRMGLRVGLDYTNRMVWTYNEIEILKKYYPEGGARLCIRKGVNRFTSTISAKANSLGLKAPARGWSNGELNLLKEYYPKGGAKLCKKIGLKRLSGSIYSKARELCLRVNT